MSDALRNYLLGKSGVNVDKSALHLDDSELTAAQNAIRDASGLDGGIRKRPGLKKFNSASMTGAVLGGIGLPLPLLVSSIGGIALPNVTDPTVDDGDMGTGVGSGSGGSGTGGGTGDGGGPVGGAGSGNTTLHGHVTIWGRAVSTSSAAVGESRGWWADSNNFDGSAADQTFPTGFGYGIVGVGNDFTYGRSQRAGEGMTTAHGPLVSQGVPLTGAPGALCRGGFAKLYYPKNYSTAVGDTNPHPLEIWFLGIGNPPTTAAGVVTTGDFATGLVATIPRSLPSVDDINAGITTINETIGSIISGPDGRLYVTVFRDAAAETAFGNSGAVYQITLDPTGFTSTGVTLLPKTFSVSLQLPIQSDFLSGEMPYALCWHNGRLWCGTTRVGANVGRVYWFNEDPSVFQWVLDHTMSDANGVGVTSLCSYNGSLYAGAMVGAAASGTAILVEARDALGNWTTSLSIAADNKGGNMVAAIVFNNKLYISRAAALTGAASVKIWQFDGTTWTAVYTGTTGDHSLRGLSSSWVARGELSFGGGGSGAAAALVQTTDGTTWVDKSANLTNATGDTLCGLNGVAELDY